MSATAQNPPVRRKLHPLLTLLFSPHYMGQHHRSFQPGEGIVREDVEDTIKSMGYIGRVGMKDTDTEILNIMIDRVDIDEVCK